MTKSKSGDDVLLMPQMSQTIIDMLWAHGYRPTAVEFGAYTVAETPTVMELVDKLKTLAVDGLVTDGQHHKQWFLERILETLGYDLADIRRELEGKGLDWPQGIAP